jgi:hypothetical protein
MYVQKFRFCLADDELSFRDKERLVNIVRELFFNTETHTEHKHAHAIKCRDCTCYSRRYTCCGYRWGLKR